MNKIDHKKIIDVMLYIAKENGQKVEFKKLLKIVYLCDRFHLRKYGRTISTDYYFAMEKGPVASATYDKCKKISGEVIDLGENKDVLSAFKKGSCYYEIIAKKEPDLKNFSNSEIDAIDTIFKIYGNKNGGELSEITHRFYEWKKYESYFRNNKTSYPIDFNDFFEEEEKGTVFENSKEKLQALREIFLESNEF